MVVLDYTLFDFAGADELIVLQERFKEVDWILFSDELSINFLRQVLFSSMAFGVVMKDNSKEEIMTAIQCVPAVNNGISAIMSATCCFQALLSPVAGTMTEDHLLTQTEKEYPERNCTGENNERDCSGKKSKLPYN